MQWATLLSALAAAAGVYVAMLTFKRQANVSVFMEYTRRYDEVMSNPLLRAHRLEEVDHLPETSDELRLALQRYLNLCAEEYCL